ncbi:MAG: DUF3137 domain-containing protein [Clostridia bacterium]|nr:DUF3137 domain-containing protein [Clostridia bacterium]MDD4376353.1 DUF3137 domain-containing protein [Clostridia bacterium]
MQSKYSITELYNKLYKENFEELETLRKKEKNKILISILIVAITFVTAWFSIVLFFSICIVLVVFIIINGIKGIKNKNKVDYTSVFKEKIVSPIIQKAIPNSLYKPKEGIPEHIYEMAAHREYYDIYRSEDLIKANIVLKNNKEINMQISEVVTQRETEDEDGKKSYTTVFRGMAGMVEMTKDIKTRVFIMNDGKILMFNKKRVKLDSSSFEKLFDVEADDPIMAMRILTAEVMEKLENLYAKLKIKFEFNVINDKLYIKFHTGGMYEPSVFSKSLELSKLQKLYDTNVLIIDVIKEMATVIDEIYV